MNNEEWNNSKNALEMLKALKAHSEKDYLNRRNSLQRYFIKCCQKKLFLLPLPEFKNGLEVTSKYIKNQASRKDVSKQNWKTEGEVFNIEYNGQPTIVSRCLRLVRIKTGLPHNKAKEYAVRFGYFIDWTTLYATDFNGEIPEIHSNFFSSEILKREIRNPF